jgi:hypothetical protein
VCAHQIKVGVLARKRRLSGRRTSSGHRETTGDSCRHVLLGKRGCEALGLGVQVGQGLADHDRHR